MPSIVAPEFVNRVKAQLNDEQACHFSLLQSLWSGYGQCFRFYSPRLNQHLVAKAVKPLTSNAHPKGWNGQQSHQRKLASYRVEHNFYQHYSAMLPVQVPTLVSGQSNDDETLLIMTDLDNIGFAGRHSTLRFDQASAILRYLAKFHAPFIGRKKTYPGLWQCGTYWHLPTRQDELSAMPSSTLKDSAQALHDALTRCPYQTVVHGDAKVANFCFKHPVQTADSVAAVDFQYAGSGIGMLDIAYFIGSALSEDEQRTMTPVCLDIYFESLHKALQGFAIDSSEVENYWRPLYPVACADFQRFLEGWSPGHWKLNQTLNDYCEAGLRYINKPIT